MARKKTNRLERHLIDTILIPAVPAIAAALVDLLQGRGSKPKPAGPVPGQKKRDDPGEYIPFEEIK
jgi:hypothetical protein